MNNFREINRRVMEDTSRHFYEILIDKSIYQSIDREVVILQEDEINPIKGKGTTNIVLSKLRTLKAAQKYTSLGKKVAILNFANNHSVGGAPWSAGAQEESICRLSTLYPCLKAKEKEFYQRHIDQFRSGEIDYMGNDDIIYTPDVLVFKTDVFEPVMIPEKDWYNVDVITCAAPQFLEGANLDEKEENIIKKRIERIISVLSMQKVDVLILGAWGCGAFHNPPEVVAKAFKESLSHYYFETVEFALFDCKDPSPNYLAFEKEFSK